MLKILISLSIGIISSIIATIIVRIFDKILVHKKQPPIQKE